MDRCPLCRAALNGAETCRRCRAELRLAQLAERRAQVLAGAAMHCLARDDSAGAAWRLRRALALHAAPDVVALQSLVALRAAQHAEPDPCRAPDVATTSSEPPCAGWEP